MKKVIVVLLGILFIVVGVFLLANGNAKIKSCTEKTNATIVDIKEDRSINSDGDDTYIYYPVIRYQVEGRTITKQSSIGSSCGSKISKSGEITLSSNSSKYRVNDIITVFI